MNLYILIGFALGCVLAGAILWWMRRPRSAAFYERQRSECQKQIDAEGDWLSPLEYDYVSTPVCWKAIRHGGGGIFMTPPLDETQAKMHVSMGGANSVIAVDRKNYFIFYRSK